MRSNYKKLGEYIRPVNIRNNDLKIDRLLGVSIRKVLMPSIANTIGTNMKTYKIINKNQFAYGPVTSRNGDKISVALLEEYNEAIISQAYTVFEVIDHEVLNPEYLMMWFRRSEFDRYARFKSHGSAREIFDWDEMCETTLPIPSIEKQREIVKEYNVIVNRIKLNEELNKKLEDTAQALYKHWFERWNNNLKDVPLSFLCSLITDGKHGDCVNKEQSGYYFISAKDLVNGEINYSNARQIIKKDFNETHKRTNLSVGDILLTNSGTIGRMAVAMNVSEIERTTFQKSVAILKPKDNVTKSYYLFCLLKHRIYSIIDMASGTSQSNLLLGDLRNFIVKYPGYEEVMRFDKLVAPMFTNHHLNIKQNLELLKLKDIHLFKLSLL